MNPGQFENRNLNFAGHYSIIYWSGCYDIQVSPILSHQRPITRTPRDQAPHIPYMCCLIVYIRYQYSVRTSKLPMQYPPTALIRVGYQCSTHPGKLPAKYSFKMATNTFFPFLLQYSTLRSRLLIQTPSSHSRWLLVWLSSRRLPT